MNLLSEETVLEVHLWPVRLLTPFVVALGVGFDAILGVEFLYEQGIAANVAPHCLVFEAYNGLIVPLVGHHPRFKHACALTHDVALYPGRRALVRFACDRPEEELDPRAPEVYLIATRKDRKLGLVVPEQLKTELIEIQSTADYPLYLPAGWEVTKVQDRHFVPRGPPRLIPCQQRAAVNVVSASGQASPSRPRAVRPWDRQQPTRPQAQGKQEGNGWKRVEIRGPIGPLVENCQGMHQGVRR